MSSVGDDHGVFHSKTNSNSFWQVDLQDAGSRLDSITIHNRKGTNTREPLGNARLQVLDKNRNVLYEKPLSGHTEQTLYPFHSTPVNLYEKKIACLP